MPTPVNALDISSAGLVKFDGTATFTGVTTTQYNVLIGNTSNGIFNLAPGTSGQVLTTNGPGINPSWQTIGSSGSSNSQVNITEDFFNIAPYTAVNTSGGSVIVNTNLQASDINNAHPGVWEVSTSSSTTGFAQIFVLDNGQRVLGGGVLTYTFYFNILSLSIAGQRYTLTLGLNDNTSGVTPTTNGIWVSYSDNVNSGNWTFNTMSGGVSTNSNSSTAVSTGWQVIQIVINAAGTSVSFSAGTTLSGLASLGTAISTNIFTSARSEAAVSIVKSSGTTPAYVGLDLVTISQNLTVPR